MEVVFWAGMICLSGLAEVISMYLYFLHGDLKRGAVSTFEITDAITTYFPIEIICQLMISVLSIINFDMITVLLNSPFVIYNIKVLMYKEYKCHALLLEEYRKKESIEKVCVYKIVFYGVSLTYFGSKFFALFSDFMNNSYVK